jgi:CDP-4-dehydro-6-deoxyglucose reductase
MSEIFQIQLDPHGGSFACAPNQTVLDAAIAAGYWLPHSCRGGTCNSCHLELIAGSVRNAEPVSATTEPVPTGQCRTCQAFPLVDLVLQAPDVPREPGQRVVTVGARVLKVQRPSADVAIVQLQVPAASGFNFQAGQYIDVLLKDGARRSYSLANVPNTEGLLELHVRRMDGGRFSPHAYDKLKPRDLLRIQGPYGTFVLHEGSAPIVLLASGTGYAPIASLLHTHGSAIAQRGAMLYWGGRRWSDLYGVESVANWQAQFPGVRLIPVLSEPQAGWQGRTGFVHTAVVQDLPDLSGHEVYACGNPLMIDAAREAFTGQAGLPRGNFYCDAFVINTA